MNNVTYGQLNYIFAIALIILLCLAALFAVIVAFTNLYEKLLKRQQSSKYDTSKISPELNWTVGEELGKDKEIGKDTSDEAINGYSENDLDIIFREAAVHIMSVFEDFLDDKGITVPCESEGEEEDRAEDEISARLYGSEYYYLEDSVHDIIEYEMKHTILKNKLGSNKEKGNNHENKN